MKEYKPETMEVKTWWFPFKYQDIDKYDLNELLDNVKTMPENERIILMQYSSGKIDKKEVINQFEMMPDALSQNSKIAELNKILFSRK